MNNLLAAAAVILSLSANPANAMHHEYKNTPEYQQMEKDTRETLKNCLNDENTKTKDCIKEYKNMRKTKKKELKKIMKEKHEN
ncbi:MAG: hypothetical protein IJ532_05325 [Alphaproteobacteria bacterium]|nr:hypothetical protein [Alphaproteobacteria bacterium]